MITLEVDGQLDLRRAFAKLEERARKRVEQSIKASGKNINKDVGDAIRRSKKTGKVYSRSAGNLSDTHRASAPGEAPANDTGNLASQIYFRQDDRLTVTVGSRAKYAAALEFGTSKIDPRPAWVPAVERERPKLLARLTRVLSEEARK